jgi:DNA damage-binding protein 1
VTLITLPSCQILSTTQLGVDTQSRDVLLISLEGIDYLLIGLGDGTLITYCMQFENGLPVLEGRRKVVLGTHPISFSSFTSKGSLCVFTSCDRPTVIYSRNGKMLFSVVNIKDCTGMAPFNSEQFPDCLSISSETGFMIGSVDDIQKVHIQTYPLGQSPKRICHSDSSGVYAVCAQKIELSDRGEQMADRVLFFEDGTMDQVLIIYHYFVNNSCFNLHPLIKCNITAPKLRP